MTKRLQDLYEITPREQYLLDLVEQCGQLEQRILAIAEELPMQERAVLEAYIELRNELDFQSVKKALKLGK